MRRWLVRGGVLVALLLLILLARCTIFRPEPVPVQVAEAEHGAVEETVTNSRAGTVEARRRAALSPDLGGRVEEILVEVGDRVEVGALLIRLEDSAQRANLHLAQRQLAARRAEEERACLEAAQAARERRRAERLAADGIVPAEQLERARTTSATAEAACVAAGAAAASATAQVDVAAAELAKMRLAAPFAGIVAEVRAERGEWISPSPPAMRLPAALDIYDPGSLHISAPMDEVDAARLALDLPARVTVDSHRDRTFRGRIVRIASYVLDVQEQNRTVEIEVELDDQQFESALLPGTSADVEVILQAHEGVLRIPTAALLDGRRVLLLREGRLVERMVETGLSNWDFTEITSGLEPGDRVVTSLDRMEVQAGARAVLEEEAP